MDKKKIRIGGGQGFWGDSNDAAIHMVKRGNLDYMGCDYLAELTLSIMQRQKNKNPEAGYARDFVNLIGEIGRESFEKNVRIISNAGGMNILGCVKKIEEIAKEQKMSGYKIGYVLGDDLKSQIPELLAQGVEFKNMDNGGDFRDIVDKILNVNVYHGHEPIVGCLEQGADIVVTGRAADSALFLSPLMYEFGWAEDDYDNLARGIMVGHLLECGGQGSGGNYDYDWRGVPRMDELGFPIAEITEDKLHITKAPDCGGIVCEQSCKEQFLYEVHDPANYITPDVTVDISQATLTQDGDNRVEVAGIKGKKRPDQLKLCVGYHAGYKVETYLSFAWPDAYEKAKYAAEILMKKMKRKNLKSEEIRIDYLGLNALHLNVANMDPELVKNMNEVVLRIAIRTLDKSEAYKIIPEISPLQLNGPPGASFFGGRAKVREVIGLWPTLVPRDVVKLTSNILEVK
ncbi:acyclic terpene utilization AtuA family protein [Clostridium sp. MT-14]|jgi:hypothetical protein|uniref:DUF1446 domain-containing protein n=1 Tax=Clostridium aromativorans TaxID=2836848 RepID=A0ABS8N1Y9_9CLOT|nr:MULTISPECIES: acyclic terpene utilization AtuA family protein [Clostridium]KAA8674775.1 DUF1446 domain-containing protein [Clostridium sp. HV4-5-A1G]MCC9293816.1 DUF1446 domain-containing protein [Clostridium aromativorans]